MHFILRSRVQVSCVDYSVIRIELVDYVITQSLQENDFFHRSLQSH